MGLDQLPINIAPVTIARPAKPPKPIVPKKKDDAPKKFEWNDPELYRGLPTSLAIHGIALIIMALWAFTPKPAGSKPFDSRLMGSDMGVEDGLTATGGLNTELDMTPAPDALPEPTVSPIAPIDLAALEAGIAKPAMADKPSAAGGMNNPNPGAGAGDGFGLAKFGDGGESIRGVVVRVGDPQFTLIWDAPVDLDLHVVEPGGAELHTFDRKSKQGGELDVDNMRGFGPENIYWMHEDPKSGERVKGQGPAGEYKWFVVYWGGFDAAPQLTHWKVRVKHGGKVQVYTGRLRALNERSKVYTLKVDASEVPAESAATLAKP